MELKGLTDQEVKDRVSSGMVNSFESPVSRSYADIIIKNVCTMFNLILFILGAALLYFNEPINALAATGVILVNVLIATIQEIKAKRRLDKIALLLRPTVKIIRNGVEVEIDPSKVVMDDVIHMSVGDQAQVDGELLDERSLEMDESPLTGESSTRKKHVGDMIYSGTFCIIGDAYFKVTALGEDTFATKMLANAKKFTKKKTSLQIETTTVTEMLMIIAFIYLAIMVIINLVSHNDVVEALKQSVIILDIVPIALFLLITITYMIAAVRMADSGILLQNSNSVESMSHVDTVCMDKTGTITTNNLVYDDIETLIDREEAIDIVRLFVTSTGSSNRTVKAIIKELGEKPSELIEEIQFSSDRKYSAVKVNSDNKVHTIFMGAWSVLMNKMNTDVDLSSKISEQSKKGLRTVLICRGADDVNLYNGDEPVVPELVPIAIISIRDEVRSDCKQIIDEFINNGMDLKVISGDDPETVDALFTLADIKGTRNIISGETLDALSPDMKEKTILETNIFGRMKPDQKEMVIETLKKNGRYVTMVGDGVNDVRSLKMANVGVALQSGSGAARGVADMVLVDDNFSALPKAIVEGKRTVTGMRDILKLYLTRNFVLAIIVGILLIVFNRMPMLPIQNTYYALITVSFAAFLMAIWAKPSDNKDLILPTVLRYSIPMAVLIAVFALATYLLFNSMDMNVFEEALQQTFNASGYSSWDEFMKHMGLTDAGNSEIVARNAMLIFLVLSGISQIFILYPLAKFYSPDRKICKDLKPSILALLLFGVVILMYNVPQVMIGLTSLMYFPIDRILLIIGIVILWFLCAIVVLRSRKITKLTDVTEKMYDKKLHTEFAKSEKDDQSGK